ncbi:hypothetical protein PR048_030775 [Dryococelus australis]|uniref:Uncharacterized protein n=1 Tax=Dryococelus australis TaxID=614101 RepID=A0ABQ9GCP4_9NEOP|nr:hypothetical protein PR048_030775 [Dryococelus australis]
MCRRHVCKRARDPDSSLAFPSRRSIQQRDAANITNILTKEERIGIVLRAVTGSHRHPYEGGAYWHRPAGRYWQSPTSLRRRSVLASSCGPLLAVTDILTKEERIGIVLRAVTGSHRQIKDEFNRRHSTREDITRSADAEQVAKSRARGRAAPIRSALSARESRTGSRYRRNSTLIGPLVYQRVFTQRHAANSRVNTANARRLLKSSISVRCYTVVAARAVAAKIPHPRSNKCRHNRAGRCRWSAGFFSRVSRFSRPFIPALFHYSPQLPPSPLKTSLLKAALISSLSLHSIHSHLTSQDLAVDRHPNLSATLHSTCRNDVEFNRLEWNKLGMEQRRNAGAGGNGRSPRKPTYQWNLLARYPLAIIREWPSGDRTQLA